MSGSLALLADLLTMLAPLDCGGDDDFHIRHDERDYPDHGADECVPALPRQRASTLSHAGGVAVGFSIYNDVVAYRAAVAAGNPTMINCAFGSVLVLVGTPIYFFYQRKAVR